MYSRAESKGENTLETRSNFSISIELMKIHYLNTLTDIFQFDIVGSCNVPNSVQYILITPRPATVRLAELLHYCLAQFSTLNLLQ